jgi:hypothetical protein
MPSSLILLLLRSMLLVLGYFLRVFTISLIELSLICLDERLTSSESRNADATYESLVCIRFRDGGVY